MGAIAALLVVFVTQTPGPGLDPDSASYLGAAESLARGRGYRIPIADWRTADSTSTLSHFPPGYSTAIALPTAFGMTSRQAARVVNALAAFVDIALVVWLVGRAAGIICALILAASLFVTPALIEQHLSVLSEPLYLAATLCALAAMVGISAVPDDRRVVLRTWAAGIAASGAILVRYAGLSVVLAVVAWVAARPGPRSTRFWRSAYAVLPSVLLVGGWVGYVHLLSGGRPIRTLGAYPGLLATLKEGMSTIVAWLVPLMSDQSLPGRPWIALVLFIAIAVLVRRAAHGAMHPVQSAAASDRPAAPLLGAAATLAPSYVVVLVASRLLADPDIPFDNRLLAPLFLLASMIIAIAARIAWTAGPSWVRLACAVVLVVWFAASAIVAGDEVQYTLEAGHDFNEAQWTRSPLLAWARANAAHRPLYSNWPQAIYFHLHRPAHELPNEDNAATLKDFSDTLRAGDGVVLAFDRESPEQIGPESLLRVPGLRRLTRLPDGSIFVAAP